MMEKSKSFKDKVVETDVSAIDAHDVPNDHRDVDAFD